MARKAKQSKQPSSRLKLSGFAQSLRREWQRLGLAENDETVLLFKHGGWREEVEFMYHCSTQWAHFLIGLRKFLETGEGTAYGKTFQPISMWSK